MSDKILKLAEGMGFEPTIGCYSYNGLANPRSFRHQHDENPRNPGTVRVSREREPRRRREPTRIALAQTGAQQAQLCCRRERAGVFPVSRHCLNINSGLRAYASQWLRCGSWNAGRVSNSHEQEN